MSQVFKSNCCNINTSKIIKCKAFLIRILNLYYIYQGLKIISCVLMKRYVLATDCIQLLNFNLPKEIFSEIKGFFTV